MEALFPLYRITGGPAHLIPLMDQGSAYLRKGFIHLSHHHPSCPSGFQGFHNFFQILCFPLQLLEFLQLGGPPWAGGRAGGEAVGGGGYKEACHGCSCMETGRIRGRPSHMRIASAHCELEYLCNIDAFKDPLNRFLLRPVTVHDPAYCAAG